MLWLEAAAAAGAAGVAAATVVGASALGEPSTLITACSLSLHLRCFLLLLLLRLRQRWLPLIGRAASSLLAVSSLHLLRLLWLLLLNWLPALLLEHTRGLSRSGFVGASGCLAKMRLRCK
jgi:hypothetical protein